MKLKSLVFLSLAIILAGCQTQTKLVREFAPSTVEIELEKAKQEVEKSQWPQALARLKLLQDRPASEPLRTELFNKALNLGREDERRYIAGGSWDEVLRIQESLYLLGEAASSPETRLKLVKSRQELGWDASLPFLLKEAIRAGVSNPQTLSPFFDSLSSLGYAANLPELYSLAPKAWPTKPTETAASSPEDLIKGTVLVMVNRGIRIENGVGLQDMELGSGFFIDKKGHILTNYHVIQSDVDPKYEGYSRVYVRLSGSKGEKVPAKVVGWDPDFDIALLKVEVTPEYVFSFSLAQSLTQGDTIRALGAPGGLESTITSGIVSALKRRLLPQGDVIQVDVPINPGNSGGPVINTKGQVVGIAFAGIRDFQGVNFAIPGDYILSLLPRLYQGGKVNHVWLGAHIIPTLQGLEVSYIAPLSPADRLGLQVGDRLTMINNTPVSDIAEIQRRFLAMGEATLLVLDWERGGKKERGWTSLSKRPENPMKDAIENDLVYQVFPALFGAVLQATGDNNQFEVKNIYSGSSSDDLGLSVGDPLQIWDSKYLKEEEAFTVQIFVKKKLGGYLESIVQLGARLNGSGFI